MTRRILLLSATLLLAACGAPEPPATAPVQMTPPPALADKGYAELVITSDFAADPPTVRRFMDTDNKLLFAMPNTERIARPTNYTIVKGETWPSPGAERIMEFSDGHLAFERVTSFTPERFEYQVWGFTSATGNNVEHIHGIQELVADPAGGTDFIWTYKVMPTAGWKKPFVQRFVDSDVRELLQTATDRVAEQAEEEITP